MFCPGNLNAGDLLGLPNKAAAQMQREVKLRPGTVDLLFLSKQELGNFCEAK